VAFVIIHALADFPRQGDYLAKQKTRKNASSCSEWIMALSARCVIHAGGVWLISGSIGFAAVELIPHALIDLGKVEERYGMAIDQVLHIGCKLMYVLVILVDLPHLIVRSVCTVP
jgi:hypothetical protein